MPLYPKRSPSPPATSTKAADPAASTPAWHFSQGRHMERHVWVDEERWAPITQLNLHLPHLAAYWVHVQWQACRNGGDAT